ncbi:MAG TPA: pyruvate dehydrogenase (acetyl-transferring), homodimeric type, partial [Xanthomonadales bacterium]|nr:pyruvate dehydrogenase (acetyl-transferring), homodimeric type [Xanthomonadales bacterium]
MNWLNDVLENDVDPRETREWIEALSAVIESDGAERAHQLLERMVDTTRRAGAFLPFSSTTDYINTIAPHLEAKPDGDPAMEWRIRCILRWNAMAMVV